MKKCIFVVEDDQKIANAIRTELERYQLQVRLAEQFDQVLEEIRASDPQLIILDINLPYQNGFFLCQQIRQFSQVPILFLSARTGEMEQVMGYQLGADDYMTKPFSLELLVAKVSAILRRQDLIQTQEESQTANVSVGGLILYHDSMSFEYRKQKRELTKNEWKLLRLLVERVGKVVSREDCLEALWDQADFVDDNTLTVNVTRLRKKLSEVGIEDWIQTKRGVGYLLQVGNSR